MSAESNPLVPAERNALPWFAVRVKSNYEKAVATALRGKGVEEFLPIYCVKRRWSDRTKIVELPLFAGYLFCRLDLTKRMPLLTTPGFLYLVGCGRCPEPVANQEVEAIRAVVDSGLPALPWATVMVGQKVRLERGPLRGVEGVVAKIAGQQRIYVAVSLLQRSVSLEVDSEWIRSANGASNSVAA